MWIDASPLHVCLWGAHGAIAMDWRLRASFEVVLVSEALSAGRVLTGHWVMLLCDIKRGKQAFPCIQLWPVQAVRGGHVPCSEQCAVICLHGHQQLSFLTFSCLHLWLCRLAAT